ncbi:MAG: heparinase II/III family protein [Planctomycetes bacterium]|nr:heparinase II/III family protein [Planctomycetota bacterium]
MRHFFFLILLSINIHNGVHSVDRQHPYLWADAQRFSELKKLVKTPIYSMRYNRLIGWADAALSKPVKGLTSSFEGEGIASACAFAYQMTGNTKYAERAKKEVFAVLKSKRWVAAHHASFTKGADLGHGHSSMLCAVVYDWCYDTFTESERASFIKNAERLSLAFYKRSLDEGDYWVNNMVTNWAGTCHGGAGCLALALYDESALAKELAPRSWKHIEAFLRGVHLEDGGGHEGVMYHHYGLGYGHVAADAMSQFFGSDNGLYDALNKKAVGYWSRYMYAPDKIYANFNDFHEGFLRDMFDLAGQGKANHYFAELFALYESKVPGGDPFLLWAADNAHGQWTYGRTAPWWLLWRRPQVKSSKQAPPLDPCVYFRGAGQAVWKSGEWWLAFNGGWTSNRSHWNKDVGTFVLVYGDQRIVRDLGYGKQDTNQHSTLLINGKVQETNLAATTLMHGSTKDLNYIASDLSAMYPGAGAKRIVRHMILLKKKYLIVFDDISCQKTSSVEQQFQLAHKVSLSGERATITTAKGPILMSNASRSQANWSGGNGATPRLVLQSNNAQQFQLCTIFSNAALKHAWNGSTLEIDGQELEFKSTRNGLLLFALNGNRCDFTAPSERNFTVYRKDQVISKKTKTKSSSKKRVKKEKSKKAKSTKVAIDYSTWDADFKTQCMAAHASEKKITFFYAMFKSDALVSAVSDKHMTLKNDSMTMPVQWSRLKLADKAALAQALCKIDSSQEMNQALAAVYLKGLKKTVAANPYLSKAGTLRSRIDETFK